MTPQTATLMARYNQWMNERMYASAGKLSSAELNEDRGAFFGSVLGTLTHLAVADTIWLHRFAEHPLGFRALVGLSAFPRPTSLRQILAEDLLQLAEYRQQLDEIILGWAEEITAGHLDAEISYASMAGVRGMKNFSGLVLHFFNHQTHHRGQATTLLFQIGVDVGVTDLLAIVPNSEV